jgi:hypothetical protein
MEKVLTFEEAFAKIEDATGIKDTDVLVSQFIRAEERNFGMFKFINDQSEEIESLDRRITETQQEIDRLRDVSEGGAASTQDVQRRRDIKHMEIKLR